MLLWESRMTGEAKQGHRYRDLSGNDVLALESGRVAEVARIIPGQDWLGRKYRAHAEWLTPLPMKYFHGKVPA